MEAQPVEIVVHILSFLPHAEVARFKGLNTDFRKLIVEYRRYLKLPAVIAMHLQTPPNLQIKTVLRKQRFDTICNVDISYSPDVKVEQGGIMITNQKVYEITTESKNFALERCFFRSLGTGNRSIQSVFDYVLGKSDIYKLDLRKIGEGALLDSLAAAIENNRCRVFSVHTDLQHRSFREHYELITAIGQANMQNRGRTSLVSCKEFAKEHWDDVRYYWEQILRLNQLAPMFNETILYVDAGRIEEMVHAITEEWKVNHVPFFIRLKVPNFSYTEEYRAADEISFLMNSDKKIVQVQHWRAVPVGPRVFRLEEVDRGAWGVRFNS